MSFPIYFVQPPEAAEDQAHIATCGWYAAPDGSFISPKVTREIEVLVFDDRNPLPDATEPLIRALLEAAHTHSAKWILLDFERPFSPACCAFVQAVAAQAPTVAPSEFCDDSAATPLFSYAPAKETYADFLHRVQNAQGWLELRPLDETIRYPLPAPAPACVGTSFFSEILQCHYTANAEENNLSLHLFDTKDSFHQRNKSLAPYFHSSIGLPNELHNFELSAL